MEMGMLATLGAIPNFSFHGGMPHILTTTSRRGEMEMGMVVTLGVIPNCPFYGGMPHIMTTTSRRRKMEMMVTVGDIPSFTLFEGMSIYFDDSINEEGNVGDSM